jgi:hypothetical protein
MKQSIVLIVLFATPVAYSAESPSTRTELLVANATQESHHHHRHHSSAPCLLDNTLEDNATLVAQRELLEKQLRHLKTTAERNPQADLTAEIAAKEQKLAALQERRRGTMTALELQLKKPKKAATTPPASQQAPCSHVTVSTQEEEKPADFFPADLPEEYASDALMLYLYMAVSSAGKE